MRSVAAGLVAAALTGGCNQIFGLDQTGELDAAVIPPDGPPGTVLLTFELQDTDTTGAPSAITFPKLTPSSIQVAPGDDPPADATVASNGSIVVPLNGGDGLGHVNPYRLIYQVDASQIPHEVQWNLQTGHLVVPVWGHPGRTAPPPGSGFDFKPAGAPTATSPLVVAFTTGIWTTAHGSMGGGEFSYLFSTARSLDPGPLGTPTAAAGDAEILAEVDADPDMSVVGNFATAFATMKVDLVGGALTKGMPMWNAIGMAGVPAVTSFGLPMPFPPLDMRIRNAIGNVLAAASSSEVDTFLGGEIPDSQMPGFAVPGEPGALDTTTIATLAFYSPRLPLTAIQWLDAFPLATTTHAFVASRLVTRVVDGATVSSGLQVLLTPSANVAASDLDTPAAMPSGATLATAAATTDLSTGDDLSVTLASSDRALVLTFTTTTASESGKRDDDFQVTLFQVSAGALTPVRVFQVLLPSVRIASDLVDDGKTYVVQIVGRNGYPGAQLGDYTQVRPQPKPASFSTATLTPGSFVVHKM